MEIGKKRQKVLDSWLLVEEQVSNEYHPKSQRPSYLKSVRQKCKPIILKAHLILDALHLFPELIEAQTHFI